MSYFELDVKQAEKVMETVLKFGDGKEAEKIINDYLRKEGGDIIKEGIHTILPVSGRKPWKGKEPAAKSTDPFQKRSENLGITIRTKSTHHYLYFPDDGSNTLRHQGNQQFMFEGASRKAEEIGNAIIEKLVERLEED